MLKTTRVGIFLYLLIVPFAVPAKSGITWHWEDQFSNSHQEKLMKWVEMTVDGIEKYVTSYPFNLHIYFHKKRFANEPVPWAHTERSYRQGVHFHVNPGYSLNDFLSDWTAPHELSHLLIPHLGQKNSWFAEGFASYMQYQIMQAMGIITEAQVQERYRRSIRKANNKYNLKNVPFISAVPVLRARRDHPTLYWGGAVYFLQVDKALVSRDSSLIEVLSNYVACCRHKRHDLDDLIKQLDRLSSSQIFSEQFAAMRRQPGFPEISNLL
jgi:hypothetical protein